MNRRLIASSASSSCLAAAEADRVALGVGGAGVGGHDQDHVAEVDLLAVGVGQRAVVHDLQQDVVDVRVRLLDLVEQHHRVRVLVDGVGQQAALVEADIARRRADQAADRVALHVLATCRSAGARCRAWRPAGAPSRSCRCRWGRRTGSSRSACSASRRPARAIFMADDSWSIASSWPKTARFRSASSCFSASVSDLETDFGGMRAILATTASTSFRPMIFLPLALGQQHLRRRRPRR